MPVIKAVIFDWSGTLVDAYGLAVLRGFTRTYEKYGIKLDPAVVLRDIGLSKKRHIALVSADYPGKNLPKTDVLYKEYLEHQLDAIKTARPLPETRRVLEGLRRDGISIGVTTGFPSVISNEILKKFPVKIDVCVSSDSVPGAVRPYPAMIHECMKVLEISDEKQVLKVGDTILDMYEGINAGCWTAGMWGNSAHIMTSNASYTREQLELTGADFIIKEIAYLPWVLEQITKKT